jgi:2-alkenal reductase
MEQRTRLWLAGGCLFLLIFAILIGVAVAAVPYMLFRSASTDTATSAPRARVERTGTIQAAPTFTPAPAVNTQAQLPAGGGASVIAGAQAMTATANLLSGQFNQLNPGVVNIQVFVNQAGAGQGAGAGSGFVLDTQGHIVTNNHVVEGATLVIIVFSNGEQEQAEIIGVDDDSDLAVVRVERLPEGVHPLPLADSDQVQVGDWAIAIGNPFGLGSSMTLGIVSALGRSIPSGATQFSIPEAIQTDAAINPGSAQVGPMPTPVWALPSRPMWCGMWCLR